MNIKKVLTVIMFFAFASAFFCGCGQKQNSPGVYICEILDGIGALPAEIKVETDAVSFRKISDAAAPVKFEGVFAGNNYTADYQDSVIQAFSNYTCRTYKTANKEMVYINADTNQIIGMLFSEGNISENSLVPMDHAERRRIAVEFASELIDTEEYELAVSEKTVVSNGPKTHVYTFVKTVNGYDTADKLIINLGENGQIKSFIHNMKGEFDSFNREIDEESVQKRVNEKLSSVYGEILKELQVEVTKKTIVKTADDTYGLSVNVSVSKTAQLDSETAIILNDNILLLVTL